MFAVAFAAVQLFERLNVASYGAYNSWKRMRKGNNHSPYTFNWRNLGKSRGLESGWNFPVDLPLTELRTLLVIFIHREDLVQ